MKFITICTISLCLVTCTEGRDKSDRTEPNEHFDLDISGTRLRIIPKPVSVEKLGRKPFTFHDDLTIIYTDSTLQGEAAYLKKLLEQAFSIDIELGTGDPVSGAAIVLELGLPAYDGWLYGHLRNIKHSVLIDANAVCITGQTDRGVFHGIQTLRQIMGLDLHQGKQFQNCRINAMRITDASRFEWRGMLLDCCRHFFDKEIVKKYIDLLALYKFNVLHWHLTEDQAWRLEIKKYPRLTEVGAWRMEGDEKYGGYYTQEDVKEIVAYATERHITVVPEIEMPGHSTAALVAYPHLACDDGPEKVPTNWGVFKDIYCPTDTTFAFLEDVLDEVCELFPSEYIHIGGDEAPKVRWEESAYCRNLLREEGLEDYEEMQAWFINRMGAYLSQKGRRIIGWDEILNDKLDQHAMIQCWRSQKYGWDASNSWRESIMSPTSHCYLDYGLDATDTEELYGFSPLPPDSLRNDSIYPNLDAIRGAECNMWTEHVPDEATLDSKVFPRLLAASEAFWGSNKDYDYFLDRMYAHYPVLDAMGVQYGPETLPVSIESRVIEGELKLEIGQRVRNDSAWYRMILTDSIGNSQQKEGIVCSGSDDFSFSIDGSVQSISVSANVHAKRYRDQEVDGYFLIHKGLGAKVTYAKESVISPYYTGGGEDALVNGRAGGDFRGGDWQGFSGCDAIVTLDLGEVMTIQEITTTFLSYSDAWIMIPRYTCYYSVDGKAFTSIEPEPWGESGDYAIEQPDYIPYTWKFDPLEARYVKVVAGNPGPLPDWHDAAGEPSWVFMDEIVVR